MSLSDEISRDQTIDAEIERATRSLRTKVTNQQSEIDGLRRALGLMERIDAAVTAPPVWVRQKPADAARKGIATFQLTDTHFDEIVRPEEVAYINAYNREIAEKRLRRWAEKSIILARDFISGVEIEGAAILATGDVFSGDIHAELKESNEDTLYGSVVHWVEQLYAAIDLLAREFGKLHIAAVVGNHGRDSKKPVYKRRAQSNIEWLMWRWMADKFKGREDVTFQVSDAMDLTVRLYDTNFLITHGDEFKGGSGISGARAPLLLGQHRTTVRQMATDTPMDFMVVGHFHTYQPPSQGLVMGGTMKGVDEFAFGKRFRPEPPSQAFWVTAPGYGPTIAAPVHVSDRTEEGW